MLLETCNESEIEMIAHTYTCIQHTHIHTHSCIYINFAINCIWQITCEVHLMYLSCYVFARCQYCNYAVSVFAIILYCKQTIETLTRFFYFCFFSYIFIYTQPSYNDNNSLKLVIYSCKKFRRTMRMCAEY